MRVIIIPGSPAKDKRKEPDYKPPNKSHWIPWTKNELEKRGIKTFTPNMPIPWKPDYDNWKKEFEKIPVDENTILIGTSAGGAFLVRWVGEKQQKIKKLILLAPTKTTKKDEFLKKLYDFKIDKNIRNLAEEITIFISNDTEERIKAAKLYAKELNGKLIELENKGHFCIWDMGTEEFPELLEEVLR